MEIAYWVLFPEKKAHKTIFWFLNGWIVDKSEPIEIQEWQRPQPWDFT